MDRTEEGSKCGLGAFTTCWSAGKVEHHAQHMLIPHHHVPFAPGLALLFFPFSTLQDPNNRPGQTD